MANYVEAIGLLQKGTSIIGTKAKDVLSGQEFDIRAKVTINCTGAWIDQMVDGLGRAASRRRYATSVGINLITHQVWQSYAAGLPSNPEKRNAPNQSPRHPHMFFIVPWRDHSIIGTWHIPWVHPPDSFKVTNSVLQEFIEEVNTAHPGLMLSMKDIQHVHYGFLPMSESGRREEQVRLVREGKVSDHQSEDGISGLISLVGVKYTTARVIAQHGVDLAIRKLGLRGPSCRTHKVSVAGGEIERFRDFLDETLSKAPAGLQPDIIEHLVYTYGSENHRILEYLQEQPDLGERVTEGSPVIKAEIVHAVRREMAQTLVDAVQRRTELGAAGLPALTTLQTCADLVGQELNWSTQQKDSAIEEVRRAYTMMPELASMLG